MIGEDAVQRILHTLLRLEDGQIGLRAEQASLREGLAGLQAEVASLREGQIGLQAGVAGLREGQISLRADGTTLRTDFLEELGQTRAAIMDRIDRLENRVTELRDDIEVAMGSTEAVQRINDTTRADLRTLSDQMSIMWKQIKRLEGQMRDIIGGP